MIALLSCREINGDSYMTAFLPTSCNEYPVWNIIYATPMLVLWGFVIPAASLWFVYKNRFRLDAIDV